MINVSYGNFKFLNASGYTIPLVSISRDFQRNGAGQTIGGTYSINLIGKIIKPTGDSFKNSGINYLLGCESGLRKAFSIDGYDLVIGSNTFSSSKVSKYSTDKTEDNWTNTINYSIDLISEINATGNNSGCFLVSSTQDEWTIDTTEDFSYSPSVALDKLGFNGAITGNFAQVYPLYKVTRTVGAVGKYTPSPLANNPLLATDMPSGTSALDNASGWVKNHIDSLPISSIIDSSLYLYNFTRSVNKSETEGSYRVTDSWLASTSGLSNFTETFNIDSALDSSMIRTVTINGTIKGLEKFDSSKPYYYSTSLTTGIFPTSSGFRKDDQDRFTNAISGYASVKPLLYSRAQQFCTTGIKYGTWNFNSQFKRAETSGLNPIPISANETFNPAEGSIQYSFSYSNRPARIIASSVSENISVNDKGFVPIVPSLFALFHSSGPIFQDLGTITSATRRVSFEASFPKTSITNASYPPPQLATMQTVVDRFDPARFADSLPLPANVASNYIKSFVKTDNADWNIIDNKITIEKTWEWTLYYTT